MSEAADDELMVFGGPELDEDLAALLMLDEYALANDVDQGQWDAATRVPQSPPLLGSTTSDSEESKTAVSASPTSIDMDARGSDSDSSLVVMSQPDDTQQRRRRHRESMARYRQERRARVDTMKDQETKLQRILLQVLAHNKHIDNGAMTKTPLQRYQAQFAELVRTREALLLEKQDLIGRVTAHDLRARAMQSISEQVFSKSMFVFPRTPGGVWLRYEEDEAPFYYEPIKEELCRKTIALGLKKMAELLRSLPNSNLPQPSVISSTQLMGWNAERAYTKNERNDAVMLFRFSRRVPRSRASLDDILDRAWRIYTMPDVMNRSSASSVRTQLVQQVHEDIVIMIRNAPEKQSSNRSRYLGLYHKMRTGDEADADPRHGRCAMIFSMLMNRAPREDMDDLSSDVRHSGNWLKDGCALLRITEKPVTPSNRDACIDVEYMGYLECLNPEHGENMWRELCLLMLLWEQAVVPQQLLGQ